MNLPETGPHPLRAVRVLQVGDFEPVAYCGMLFAQVGAEVTRAVAADSPGSADESDWGTVRSAYLNDAKKIIPIDDGDPRHLIALARESDVVIAGSDFPWEELAGSVTPISVEISRYGHGGPHDDWMGNELVFASRGGAAEYTLDEDGTPVYGYGRRFHYLAGNYAFVAAVALAYGKTLPAEPQHPRVQVSVLETVVSMLGYSTTQYSYNGTSGVTGQAGPRYTLRCRDGYIVLGANGSWPPIATMIGRPELADDPRFLTQGPRYVNAGALGEMVEEWAAQNTIAEAVQQAEPLSVPLVALASGEDLMTDQHLADRDAWETIDVPGLGSGKAPRAPFIIDGQRLGRSTR